MHNNKTTSGAKQYVQNKWDAPTLTWAIKTFDGREFVFGRDYSNRLSFASVEAREIDHDIRSLLKENDIAVARTRAETFRMSWHTARLCTTFVHLLVAKARQRAMETAQHRDSTAKNQPAEIAMFQISEAQESPAFNGGRSFLALRAKPCFLWKSVCAFGGNSSCAFS